MRLTRSLRALLVSVGLLVVARAAEAQRYWHDEQGRSAFQMDFGMPFLKDSLNPGKKFYSGAMIGAFSLKSGDGFRVEGDIPVIRAGYDFGGTTGTLTSFRLGNPYLGLRIGDDEKLVTATIGARAPVGGKPSSAIGQKAVAAGIASNYDEFEAFAAKTLTIRSALEVHRQRSNGVVLGLRGGPTMLINTSNDPKAEGEIFFDWGARVGYAGTKAMASLALTGRYLMTAPYYNFDCVSEGFDDRDPITHALIPCNPKSFAARSYHTMSGTVELRHGSVRPRATLRIPMDKGRKNVAGASVTVGLSIAK